MSRSNNIHRITAENYVPGQGIATQAQEKGTAFFKQNVLPAIERVLQKFETLEEIIRIDKLQLDLNIEGWDKDVSNSLRLFELRLEEMLAKIIAQNKTVSQSENKKYTASSETEPELFICLLQHGRLPWWAQNSEQIRLNELATPLLQQAPNNFISELKHTLQNKAAKQRLAHSLSQQNVIRIIELLVPQQHQWIVLLKKISDYASTQTMAFKQLEPFIYQLALQPIPCPENPADFISILLSDPEIELPLIARELATAIRHYFSSDKQKTSLVTNTKKTESKPDEQKNPNTTSNETPEKPVPLNIKDKSNKPATILKSPKNNEVASANTQNANADEQVTNTSSPTITKNENEKNVLAPEANPSAHANEPLRTDTKESEETDAKNLSPVSTPNSTENDLSYPDESSVNPLSAILQDEEDAQGRYYVTNAGLIILAPFLPALFQESGLVRFGKFISNEAHEKAICLIHYLLTETEDFEEHFMLLNKIICGFPVHNPLIYKTILNQKDKDECASLLASVAQHWTALKNTAPQNMRNAFFWRNALIEKAGNGWNLKIERQTIDILVDKLPWGISVIKLPWLDDLIFVDWT